MAGRLDSSVIRSPKFILRVIELIFSIITFALVAEWNGWSSKINFTLFTGITAMFLCMVFIVIYLLGLTEKPTVVLTELIANVLWWIFWIATAGCLSSLIGEDAYNSGDIKASTAFAWLTFFLWSVSTFISIREVMQGRQHNVTGPTIPNSSDPAFA